MEKEIYNQENDSSDINNENEENEFSNIDFSFEKDDDFLPKENQFSEPNLSQPLESQPEQEKTIPSFEVSSNYPFQPPTPIPSPTEPRHILAKVIIGLLSFLIIGGIGVATALATRVWDPLWNPFRPSPETVIHTMLQKMKELKSLHTETNAEIVFKNKSEFKLKTHFWSNQINSENKANLENLKSEGGLNINFISEGMEFSFAGEIKQIGKVTYFKITTIPAAPFFQELFEELEINLNDYKNVWIKFDQDSIFERFKDFISPEDYKKLKEEQKKSLEKQQKIMEKISEKFENLKLFLLKEELRDEKIGNKKYYHYVVLLNKKEIQEKIPEIFKIILQELSSDNKEEFLEISENLEDITQKLDEFSEKIGDFQIDLFIDKKDNYLYKAKMEKNIDLKNFDLEKGSAILNFDINFSRFNEITKIEDPQDYKKFEDLFYDVFKRIFENITKSKKRAQLYSILSDLQQLRILAELIYEEENNSYKNLCLKNNLNTNNRFYGKELKNIQESINQTQGGSFTLRCYSSNDSYCIETNLTFLEEKICMDSSGVLRQIPNNYKCIGTGTSKNPYRCPVVSYYNLPSQPEKNPGIMTYLQSLQSSLLNSISKIFRK